MCIEQTASALSLASVQAGLQIGRLDHVGEGDGFRQATPELRQFITEALVERGLPIDG